MLTSRVCVSVTGRSHLLDYRPDLIEVIAIGFRIIMFTHLVATMASVSRTCRSALYQIATEFAFQRLNGQKPQQG